MSPLQTTDCVRRHSRMEHAGREDSIVPCARDPGRCFAPARSTTLPQSSKALTRHPHRLRGVDAGVRLPSPLRVRQRRDCLPRLCPRLFLSPRELPHLSFQTGLVLAQRLEAHQWQVKLTPQRGRRRATLSDWRAKRTFEQTLLASRSSSSSFITLSTPDSVYIFVAVEPSSSLSFRFRLSLKHCVLPINTDRSGLQQLDRERADDDQSGRAYLGRWQRSGISGW